MKRILLAVVLAAAPTAFAQPPGATPPAGGPPNAQPNAQQQAANIQQRRERIKKRIRTMRAFTLTEELKLDQQTAEKLFPLLSKYDDELDKLLGTRADIQRRLNGASNGKDPRAADKVIDEAIANQRAFWDVEEHRLVELRKILSPQQIARLLVVLPPLERKIENQLRNAIQGGGPNKGPGGGKPPPDDLDDRE